MTWNNIQKLMQLTQQDLTNFKQAFTELAKKALIEKAGWDAEDQRLEFAVFHVASTRWEDALRVAITSKKNKKKFHGAGIIATVVEPVEGKHLDISINVPKL